MKHYNHMNGSTLKDILCIHATPRSIEQFLKKHLFYVYVCAWMNACVPCVCRSLQRSGEASVLLKLELQAFMSLYVGAGN